MHAGIEAYEQTLLEQAAAYAPLAALGQLTQRDLVALTRERGIDFATAVLYDRVLSSSRWLGAPDGAAELPSAPVVERRTWAIVPGAFYQEQRTTGADGLALRLEAERLGIRCEIVPLESFGSVARNADILARWLRERRDEAYTLISLSKGSLEVRRLLERDDAEALLEPVRAWVSLSGLLTGSPLVSWLRRRPWRLTGVRGWLWWHGYDFNGVREIDRTSALVEQPVQMPRHMMAVHVVGFPLRHHLLSPLMERGHRRLAEHGPNDGAGVILADVANWPGAIYPVWGADHYLRTKDAELSAIVLQVLGFVAARQSAAQPHTAESTSLEVGT